jgi:ubiquinone/menaquinone biosynthesis C-methylase UbiE
MIDIDRGTNGRTARLRSLDVESQQDFVRGFREWMVTDMDAQIRDHSEALLQAHGVTADRASDVETLRSVFDPDPLIAARLRVWITNQRQLWSGLSGQLGRHRDHYLAELDRSDAMGPGSVELDPDLNIPDYCRHEIHIQPGGYVGDELSGPIYHYGTNSFYMGQNDADEFHTMLARRTARPHDGQVKTIVDLGTGIGQLAMTLKETFPEADVIGLDVAGPMLRYAHKRAVELGLDVRFVQRLAEDTKLASGSVDIATAYILFHEVPKTVAQDICAEVFRILRPGAVFDVTDFATGALKAQAPAFATYRSWADHHFNGERWREEFVNSDFVQTLRDAGFEAELQPSKVAWMTPNYVARKPG